MKLSKARMLRNGDKLYRDGKFVATFRYELRRCDNQPNHCRYYIEWNNGHEQLITDSAKGMTTYDYTNVAAIFD